MRILVVTNMWPTGGGSRGSFVRSAVEDLRKHRPELDLEVEVVVQGRSRLDYALGNLRVRRRVKRERPDVVWVHFGLTALTTGLLPRRTPTVVTFHGSDVNVPWMRRLARPFTGRADAWIFVSRNLADRLPGGRARFVIPGGVDPTVFHATPRDDARAQLGWSREERYVVFGGNPAVPVKDHDRFMRVLDMVRKTVRVAPVHLSGNLDAERVALTFSAADALVLTSRRGAEGSPTVVKEALSVGLPVVSVDVGDVRERTAGVRPGGVVPWSDDDAVVDRGLADTLLEVLLSGARSDGPARSEEIRSDVTSARIHDVLTSVAAATRSPR